MNKFSCATRNSVPIETYNHVFRQWQGWSSEYKNIEARNKQLEAERTHVNACRDEDTNATGRPSGWKLYLSFGTC